MYIFVETAIFRFYHDLRHNKIFVNDDILVVEVLEPEDDEPAKFEYLLIDVINVGIHKGYPDEEEF